MLVRPWNDDPWWGKALHRLDRHVLAVRALMSLRVASSTSLAIVSRSTARKRRPPRGPRSAPRTACRRGRGRGDDQTAS
jgi:hypothetical protein